MMIRNIKIGQFRKYIIITLFNIVLAFVLYFIFYTVNLFLYEWEFIAREKIGKCNLFKNEYILRCPQMQYFYMSLQVPKENVTIPGGYIEFYYNENSCLKVFFKSSNSEIGLPITFFVNRGSYWGEYCKILLKDEDKYKIKILFDSLPPNDTSIYVHGHYTKKDSKSFHEQILFELPPDKNIQSRD